jgi:acyl-CoA reductase-like NAD-dependent aldehyde dehydrogenase
MKQKRAVLFVKYKSGGESASTAEQMARADPVYAEASAEWMAANFKHRRLDAAAEARRLSFEAWRTLNANKRAEMNLR